MCCVFCSILTGSVEELHRIYREHQEILGQKQVTLKQVGAHMAFIIWIVYSTCFILFGLEKMGEKTQICTLRTISCAWKWGRKR